MGEIKVCSTSGEGGNLGLLNQFSLLGETLRFARFFFFFLLAGKLQFAHQFSLVGVQIKVSSKTKFEF